MERYIFFLISFRSGLHNPFKNPERYLLYGDVTAKLAAQMRRPEVEGFFADLIARVVPKSRAQCLGEVVVTRCELQRAGCRRVCWESTGREVAVADCPAVCVSRRKFLENFAGDNVRFLARSFGVPGDHWGQMSHGHRFPFGGVGLITPFNFPLEIPALQASDGVCNSKCT